ncbi:MAG TPA: hypothetical protein VHB21_16210, partial [Minicystis sp.]|nr:hypothetical protein [Minicystis sp.]
MKKTRTILGSLAGLLLAAACNAPGAKENVDTSRSALFTNADFESGTNNTPPPSWTVTPFLNPMTGITIATPETRADLNLQSGGQPLTVTLVTNGGPESQPDALMGAQASLRWPKFGTACALVNENGRNRNVNSMAQTMTVAAGDVDPIDNQVHVRFVVAPVLEDPGHTAEEQPYFYIQATNVTQNNAVIYSNFNFSNQTGVPWKTRNAGGRRYVYTDWQLVDISGANGVINQGDQIDLEFIAAGCSLGGHMGQLYVDGGAGPSVPGLFLSGTGPFQVNACDDVAYALTYENGGTGTADGVTLSFATPPGTTFQSITESPSLTCMTPPVGTAGTITCTVGTLAPGAGGTLQITVNVPCGDTGVVTAGDYSIQGTGIGSLLGPVINTIIGCSSDNQCSAGNWCDVSGDVCTPQLPNGTQVPTDTGHMNPTLDGTCGQGVGPVVCQSQVCSVVNDACGYANGEGPCTPANGATVCQSGACSQQSGVCVPMAGGCGTDADCQATEFCDTPTFTCTPKVANGMPIPNVPGHDPTLDGTCTQAAGASACASGVCDTADDLCGYADGDGPCDMTSGPTVCRSGMCSSNGTCEPSGGCNVDADCGANDWCNESAHMCTPKLPNGTAVPSDPAHMDPALDGTCGDGVGPVVCQSGVCDPNDNACGYADGDGPCTVNGECRMGSACKNGTCEPQGCQTDADCSGGKWCNETQHMCIAKLPNGAHVPSDPAHMNPTLDGNCTNAAGTLVCQSGVCDTNDDACGYADGDGPCTQADGGTVCRSGMCSQDGTCEPKGGCNEDADCTNPDKPVCDIASHMCVASNPTGTGGSMASTGSHATTGTGTAAGGGGAAPNG